MEMARTSSANASSPWPRKISNNCINSQRSRDFGYIVVDQPLDQRRPTMAVNFTLNGKPQTVDVSPQMPLLWVLRDTLGMTGTKFGCGMALCGCCTVHINGQPIRSCVTPISSVAGKTVTTIEGLSSDNSHPVQRAWLEVDVPQCGYSQSGQIMTAAGLLKKTAHPTDADIDEAMHGNICRCGTYQAIRHAVHLAAQYQAAANRNGAVVAEN